MCLLPHELVWWFPSTHQVQFTCHEEHCSACLLSFLKGNSTNSTHLSVFTGHMWRKHYNAFLRFHRKLQVINDVIVMSSELSQPGCRTNFFTENLCWKTYAMFIKGHKHLSGKGPTKKGYSGAFWEIIGSTTSQDISVAALLVPSTLLWECDTITRAGYSFKDVPLSHLPLSLVRVIKYKV